jgi:signal transduction histidine kinase
MVFVKIHLKNGSSDLMTSETSAPLSSDSTVSHEFANSLASVRSLSELLVDHPGLAAGDRIRFLTIIREETERLAHLLGRLDGKVESATLS